MISLLCAYYRCNYLQFATPFLSRIILWFVYNVYYFSVNTYAFFFQKKYFNNRTLLTNCYRRITIVPSNQFENFSFYLLYASVHFNVYHKYFNIRYLLKEYNKYEDDIFCVEIILLIFRHAED